MYIIFFLAVLCIPQSDLLAGDKDFQVVKIADGVYAFIPPDPTKDIVNGNSTVIICSNYVVVFDANSTPGEAGAVLTEIRKLTHKPVRYVINSHWHWDHWLGNQVYKEAFPDCEIISSTETRRIIELRFPRFYKNEMEQTPDVIRTFKNELADGRKENGDSLTSYEKLRWAQTLKDAEAGFEEEKRVRYTPPTLTFEESMVLDAGGRELRIIQPGPGNTTGDVYMYMPKEKILITGDILVSPIPYAFGVSPDNWIRTLRKWDHMDISILVPGHGEVQYDKKYLRTVIAMFESVKNQVESAMKERAGLEETKKRVKAEVFRSALAENDAARNYVFTRYFLNPFIERAFKEAQGEIGR